MPMMMASSALLAASRHGASRALLLPGRGLLASVPRSMSRAVGLRSTASASLAEAQTENGFEPASFAASVPPPAVKPPAPAFAAAPPLSMASGHARLAVAMANQGATSVTLSQRMVAKVTRNLLEGIDLIVYDMAGTTVEEGGTVYRTLQAAMVADGLDVPDEAMHPWHGAKKEKVIEHFVREAGFVSAEELEKRILRISDTFIARIQEAYYQGGSKVRLIDEGLLGYFRALQRAGVKVALDTGYPQDIQQGLVKHLGFDQVVDAYISSYEVREGRPYPYMIYQLMERCGIESVKRVAKVGDSVRDIEEGRNAGCGLVIGVLSGADTAEALMDAGAHVIATSVTDLPVPRKRAREVKLRLPDLS